jgi:4,5-dihydroxyphthalate decarboxylase
MHGVVIRRRLYDKNPWIAESLYQACEEAKNLAIRRLKVSGAQRVMLPWLVANLDEVDELFGGDPCTYGIEANRKTLSTLIDYMHEQGFIARKPRVEELFVPVG